MTYVYGALAGLAFGALVGLAKYLLLWRPLLLGRRAFDMKSIGISQAISMVANAAALLTVFFLRRSLPFSFEATLIATALALSLFGRITTIRK